MEVSVPKLRPITEPMPVEHFQLIADSVMSLLEHVNSVDMQRKVRAYFSRMEVSWVRNRSFFGMAWMRYGSTPPTIELSFPMLTAAGPQQTSETIQHEVCHHVAFLVFGDDGHGRGWKQCMRWLGLEPKRCAVPPRGFETRRQKRLPVCCQNGHKLMLTSRTFNRVVGAMETGYFYRCGLCKSQLIHPLKPELKAA